VSESEAAEIGASLLHVIWGEATDLNQDLYTSVLLRGEARLAILFLEHGRM
jgi:hypothetical protein